MKYQRFIFILLFFFSVLPLFSQEKVYNKYHPDYPLLVRPRNHDPNFKNFPVKSFYESRDNWQTIIDTTWGAGRPFAEKQNIFDQYADAMHDEFDGFLSLGMNWQDWDSLRNHYYLKITDSTSRGSFSANMSQLANSLRDMHTQAYDQVVIQTPLNPGTPLLLLSGYLSVEHFGAVLTALPDSNLLVLRVVPNHPLGLQPGDIILGYEGIPWKILVQELFAAGLPFVPNGIGAASAYSDFLLLGAGMNWHLFDTMDIVQYSTGDTLHLAVAPMINLNVPFMLNNEQMEIPGVPFPDFSNGQIVSYGTINNTNIGYIYLFQEWPEASADDQFAQAVNALKNTEGLIIDMRLNFGGWALFSEAFDILFNDFTFTIEDAYRYGPSTLTLVPSGNAFLYQIDGLPVSLYDHPIAVLLGPTCISMGDLTAQRLRYHPTVRFFGKPPGASLGDNLFIEDYQDWNLRYSISDMYHVNQPGSYLNRAEFPIDFPVWHNPANVANGIDAVVQAALDWMNNLVYSHDLTLNDSYFSPGVDTVKITALLENPNSHTISSTVYIENVDTTFRDSVCLHQETLGQENEIWKGEYVPPAIGDLFKLSIAAYDSTNNEEFVIRNASRFITIGPLELAGYDVVQVLPMLWGYRTYLNLSIINAGLTGTAPNVVVELTTEDTTVWTIGNAKQIFGNIAAGVTVTSPQIYTVNCWSYPLIDTLRFKINIYSDGYLFWRDSSDVIVGIRSLEVPVPQSYTLYQNYPNPFNPITTVKFDLPKTSEVTLKVFNILGEEVTTIVSEKISAGSYSYEWDASGLASGIYLYRLQAGDYLETRKMVLMR
jgi:C-terminal processing protease CtpA/Prc